MGFTQCRADADQWIKKDRDNKTYEYIATYVDNLILVMKDPKPYIEHIKKNIKFKPEYYLCTNIIINDKKIKVSMTKYIKETIESMKIPMDPSKKKIYRHHTMIILN